MWYELTEMLRKRIRQNIDEELRAGMDKIESLFSQWKESSPKPNKANDKSMEIQQLEESLKTEHVEIPPADEALMESMENHEDEGTKAKDHDVQRPSEVIFPFSDNDDF